MTELDFSILVRDSTAITFHENQQLREIVTDPHNQREAITWLRRNNAWVAMAFDIAKSEIPNGSESTINAAAMLLMVKTPRRQSNAAERTPLELAAPDLLAACKAALSALDNEHAETGYNGFGERAMIAAAIAKAESEATKPE